MTRRVSRYRGPTLTGAGGIILALAFGASQLGGWESETLAGILLWSAAGVLVISVLWVVGTLAWPRMAPAFFSWVKAGLEDVEPTAATRPGLNSRDRAKLRAALNQVSEEIEYLQDRVRANDAVFWLEYNLPVWKWHEHGALIAEHETAVHLTARRMYAEVDRLQHCIDGKRKLADLDDPPETLMEVLNIQTCDPSKFLRRAADARLKIRRALTKLQDG